MKALCNVFKLKYDVDAKELRSVYDKHIIIKNKSSPTYRLNENVLTFTSTIVGRAALGPIY